MICNEDKMAYNAFIRKAKSNNYSRDIVELAIMFCCSRPAIKKLGNYRSAFEVAEKICERAKDENEYIAQLGLALGVDE